LFYIFLFLLPRTRTKCKLVSRDFYQVYLKYLQSRNNLDPNKYILYRKNKVIGAADVLTYEIVRTHDNHIYLKPTKWSKKETKVKKLFNKHNVVYFKFHNNFLYVYKKEYLKEIGKDICHNCGKNRLYNYCGIYVKVCKFKDCKREKFYCNRNLRNIDSKEIVKDFNEFCEHKLCYVCTLKVSIQYNVKRNNYVHKLLIY
jgi:hypothetical protein